MCPFDAWTARSALDKIFWGTLVCVIDFHFTQTSGSGGFRFDVISDVVGAAMIAWGLGQLLPLIPVSAYAKIMSFCQLIAAVAVLEALAGHIVMDWPPPVRLLSMAFSLICLLAVYRFCDAMRLFCSSLALTHVEQSWRLSQQLFLWLNAVPAVILHAASLLVMFSREKVHLNIGPLAIAIVIAAMVPLVHILVSIRRTRSALFQPPQGVAI